jgi:hypothetical protein
MPTVDGASSRHCGRPRTRCRPRIQNILNIINGAIQSELSLLGAVSQSLQALYQQIVWRSIDRPGAQCHYGSDQPVPRCDAVDLHRRDKQRNIAVADHAGINHSKSPHERFSEPNSAVLRRIRCTAHRGRSRYSLSRSPEISKFTRISGDARAFHDFETRFMV